MLLDALDAIRGVPTLYVRLDRSRLSHLNVETFAEFSDEPLVATRQLPKGGREVFAVGAIAREAVGHDVSISNPFAHPRVVVHGFEIGQALLRFGIHSVLGNRLLLRPRLVLHPLRELEGGLTEIEARVLRELGFCVRAKSVALHVGAKLSAPDALALAERGDDVPTVPATVPVS